MQLDLFGHHNIISNAPTDTKYCYSCEKDMPLLDFRILVRRHGDRHTLSSTCSSCDDKASLVKKEFRRHNVLIEGYECPICNKSHEDYKKQGRYFTQSPFSVDHCQKTMVARGWICNPCNSAMGLAQHNTDILSSMIDYLNNGKETQ